jgi:hypothetical protein
MIAERSVLAIGTKAASPPQNKAMRADGTAVRYEMESHAYVPQNRRCSGEGRWECSFLVMAESSDDVRGRNSLPIQRYMGGLRLAGIDGKLRIKDHLQEHCSRF